MKARIKATGEIIEVSETPYQDLGGRYFDCPEQKCYFREDIIDILPEKETAVLEGWICRDEDNSLMLFTAEKPERVQDYWDSWDKYYHEIPSPLFPSVTWQSEPKKVRIVLTPIDE